MSGNCQCLVKLMACKAQISPFFDNLSPKSIEECTTTDLSSKNEECSTYQNGDWTLKICGEENSSITMNNISIDGKTYALGVDSNCFITFKDLASSEPSLIGDMSVCGLDSYKYHGGEFPISKLTFHPCKGSYSGKFEDLEYLRILKKGLLQMLPDFMDEEAKKDTVQITVPTREFLWIFDCWSTEIDEIE